MELRIPRGGLNRSLQVDECLLYLAFFQKQRAKIVSRLRKLRPEPHGLSETRYGFFLSSGMGEGHPQVIMCNVVAWIDFDGMAIKHCAILPISDLSAGANKTRQETRARNSRWNQLSG